MSALLTHYGSDCASTVTKVTRGSRQDLRTARFYQYTTMKGGTFLYPALLKTLVLPPILTLFLTRFIPTLHPLLLISLCISSCPALFIFRSYLAIWVSTYKARKLGAEDIPRVRGKMLLNFDVLLDWSRSGTDEEAGRMMVVLGRKYGGTYNTRVLGEDSVSWSHCPVFGSGSSRT